MVRKTTLVALALLALFGLQFADCLSVMSMDQESMECCGSTPCHPANQSHDCCRTMVSAQTPSALPAAHSDFSFQQAAFIVDYPPSLDIVTPVESVYLTFEAPQHSPPDLYTLHSSLLI